MPSLPPLTKDEILIALDAIWNKATNDQRPEIDALADAVRQRGVGSGEHPVSVASSLAAGSMTPPEATEEMVKPEPEADPKPEAESESSPSPSPSASPSPPSPSPPPSAHAATDWKADGGESEGESEGEVEGGWARYL